MELEYDGRAYCKKILQLREKLRKSEEERIRLEERFKILVQETRNRHDACINRLRLRYIDFLEEQCTRDERNHNLLGALDRVDSDLSLMTAKTDRLNVLRKQYEAYLLRVYANRGPPGSITGDSGIASQNEDRCLRRNIAAGQVNFISPEGRSISPPKVFHSNRQENQYVSPSAFNLNEPSQSIPYDNRPTAQTIALGSPNDINHRKTNIRRGLNPSEIPCDPSSQQFPLQNPSSLIYQNAQIPQDSNSQFIAPHYQVNPNQPDQRLTSINSLRQPNVPLNGTWQNRIASPISQGYFNPSVSQSLPRDVSKLSRNNLQPLIGHANQVFLPSSSSTAPMMMETHVPAANLIKQTGPLPSYMDYSLRNSQGTQRSIGEISGHPLTTSAVDDMIRRHEHFIPQYLNDNRTPHRVAATVKETPLEKEEGRTTMILENELDRYIEKIRSLHRNYDMQSFEELDHEQNTSGDLLNVTLSDDGSEFPTEEKAKEEQLGLQEMEKVLALANDLASRTTEMNDVSESRNVGESENRNLGETRRRQSEESVSGRSHAMPLDLCEGRGSTVAPAKDEISDNIAPQSLELELHENIENSAKQETASSKHFEPLLAGVKEDDENTVGSVSSLIKVAEQVEDHSNKHEKEHSEYPGNVYRGEESELEQDSFDVLEELEPWNVEHMEKEIREVPAIDARQDRSTKDDALEKKDAGAEQINIIETEKLKDSGDQKKFKEDGAICKADSADVEDETQSQTGEADKESMRKDELQEHVGDTSVRVSKEMEYDYQCEGNKETEKEDVEVEIKNKIDERKEESDAVDHGPGINQNDQPQDREINVDQQQYTEELNQPQEYAENPEQAYADLNQEYTYDQNAQYGGSQNQGYQDYNAKEYIEGSNEQYTEYMGEQYGQYVNNPDGQYDPNVEYEQDPNQQYSYSYDQQYDPNQVYEPDPNQSYAYNETYDPNHGNQEEGNIQNQEYVESDPVENVPKTEETVEGKEQSQETNEPKKKKDVIKSLLDSDTESTIERNVSNTESDFDFN